jgi:hypothetical protein
MKKRNIASVFLIVSCTLIGCTTDRVLVLEYVGTSESTYLPIHNYALPTRSIKQHRDTSFTYSGNLIQNINNVTVIDTTINISGRLFLVNKGKHYLVQNSFEQFYQDTLVYPIANNNCMTAIPDSIVSLHGKKVMHYTIFRHNCDINQQPCAYRVFQSTRVGENYVYPRLGIVKGFYSFTDVDNIIQSEFSISKIQVFSHKKIQKVLNWWQY